jgi:hypothetical protein
VATDLRTHSGSATTRSSGRSDWSIATTRVFPTEHEAMREIDVFRHLLADGVQFELEDE